MPRGTAGLSLTLAACLLAKLRGTAHTAGRSVGGRTELSRGGHGGHLLDVACSSSTGEFWLDGDCVYAPIVKTGLYLTAKRHKSSKGVRSHCEMQSRDSFGLGQAPNVELLEIWTLLNRQILDREHRLTCTPSTPSTAATSLCTPAISMSAMFR